MDYFGNPLNLYALNDAVLRALEQANMGAVAAAPEQRRDPVAAAGNFLLNTPPPIATGDTMSKWGGSLAALFKPSSYYVPGISRDQMAGEDLRFLPRQPAAAPTDMSMSPMAEEMQMVRAASQPEIIDATKRKPGTVSVFPAKGEATGPVAKEQSLWARAGGDMARMEQLAMAADADRRTMARRNALEQMAATGKWDYSGLDVLAGPGERAITAPKAGWDPRSALFPPEIRQMVNPDWHLLSPEAYAHTRNAEINQQIARAKDITDTKIARMKEAGATDRMIQEQKALDDRLVKTLEAEKEKAKIEGIDKILSDAMNLRAQGFNVDFDSMVNRSANLLGKTQEQAKGYLGDMGVTEDAFKPFETVKVGEDERILTKEEIKERRINTQNTLRDLMKQRTSQLQVSRTGASAPWSGGDWRSSGLTGWQRPTPSKPLADEEEGVAQANALVSGVIDLLNSGTAPDDPKVLNDIIVRLIDEFPKTKPILQREHRRMYVDELPPTIKNVGRILEAWQK